MHNRLKQFLAAENITQAQFADRIRIGKANVSHVLAGRNKPGYDFISAIMTGFPELNLNGSFSVQEKCTPILPYLLVLMSSSPLHILLMNRTFSL